MVSKLLLAVAETLAQTPASEETTRAGLLAHFDSIKRGIGAHKSPADYGAFPMDPYSHTPAFAGVQQPGMTGQVKEDLICRYAELGIEIRDGCVHFSPGYLKREEFFESARDWRIPGQDGGRIVGLPAGSLAFTLCGVPVIYCIGESAALSLHGSVADCVEFSGRALDRKWTRALFARDGSIDRIEVTIDTRRLR
jgi:hypothetical protein